MKLNAQCSLTWLNACTGKRVLNTQKGFTLVELMIALTIGLILLLVIGTVFSSSRQAFRVQEDNARIQENGRFALEIIGRSIKQAGHAEIPFTGLKVAFTGVPIAGTDGVGAADTITLQYDGVVGDQSCDGELAVAGDIIQNHFNLDAANAELRCLGTSDLAPGVPGASPVGSALVENIEDLQVLYGIDTTGDQSANRYIVAPATLVDPLWNQVVTARVCVLVRSDKTNIVVSAGQYRDCTGNNVNVPADGRLRRAFTSTFNLRNRVNLLP